MPYLHHQVKNTHSQMKSLIKNPAKVAVLLASYQGLPWIEEQISSIINQKSVTVLLTISDDESDDGTADYLQKKQKHAAFTLLPSVRSGSAAQNFFRLLKQQNLKQVDYVAFSDQDDIWLPHKLDTAIKTIRLQNVDAYSSSVKAFWHDGRNQLINKAQPQTIYDYMFESAGPGCTFVITQALALSLQEMLTQEQSSLNNVALHDWFIYAFARSRGYQWYIDPTPTLLYRQHADNAVGANSGIKAMKSRWSKLKEGWYVDQILLIAHILNYQHSVPVRKIQRLNLWDRVYLALFSWQFRRRLRDRFAFAFFILFLARKP
jgi:rhamnosyltransferase